MESCRYFSMCSGLAKDLDEIKRSDAAQEASMKSLHKRQDKADEQRDGLEGAVHTLVNNLTNHMTWEEEKSKLDHDAKEQKDKEIKELKLIEKERLELRLKLALIAFSIIVGVATWFTSYVFESIQGANASIFKMEEYNKFNDKHVENVNKSLEEIKQALYRIVK